MSVIAISRIRRFRKALLVLPVVAALAACATPTPYQPLGARGTGASGGFAETRLTSNRWRVLFAGNSLTARRTVENYLLYRSAELTVQQGYDSFAIVEKKTDKTVTTNVWHDPFYSGPYGWWRPSWRYYGGFGGGFGWRSWDPWFGDPFWADNIDVTTVQRFEANAEIEMFHGTPPAGRHSFDAREVMTNLGPTIQLPQQH